MFVKVGDLLVKNNNKGGTTQLLSDQKTPLQQVILPVAAGTAVGIVGLVTGGTTAPTPQTTIPGEGVRYFNYDHLGNTRVSYSFKNSKPKTYQISGIYDYHPYGKILRSYTLAGNDKYLSTMHQRDNETGLDYRGARFYDSEVGRFLSLDPLAVKYPAWSPYNYVLGNPIMFVDPDGRDVINVYEKSRNKAQNNLNTAQNNLNNYSKGDDGYRNARKAFNESQRAFNRVDRQFQIVQKAIGELKHDDQKYFDRINNMTTPTGEKINVYVSASKNTRFISATGNEVYGETIAQLFPENYDRSNNFLSPSTEQSGKNSIGIKIGSMGSGKTLKHEFGHAEVAGKLGLLSNRYYLNSKSESSNDIENPNNPSGRRALDAEESYDGDPNTSLLD